MDATIFNENEIKTILVNVVKELYPFYREIKPWVAIYSKDKFLNLDNPPGHCSRHNLSQQ